MPDWLKGLSKTTLASLILLGAVFFVMVSDPPKEVCDAQIELFKKTQAGRILPPEDANDLSYVPINRLLRRCKLANSAGGCYEYFEALRRLLGDIDAVAYECTVRIARLSEVRPIFTEGLQTFVKIAWGEAPPRNRFEKFGWLESPDMNLYCQLRERFKKYYGKQAYRQFQLNLMKELPETKDLAMREIFSRTILSVRCSAYL